MNELALFAGAGGGILGGKLLGWRTVCAVEIDTYAASVLVARQNDGCLEPFPIWDDVRTFDGRPWRGIVDVVSGGFPCQDISSAGKGAGITGAKSGLWKEMARIIGEVRPLFALVENSPILTSRGLGVVLGDLAEMGYDARWGVLGASDAIWLGGVPAFDHERARLFIAASDSNRVRELQPKWCIENERGRTGNGFETLADAMRFGCGQVESPVQAGAGGERPASAFTNGIGSAGWTWWLDEPDVGRMAHGVAARVDRVRTIGNGQVPAVAALAWTLLGAGLPDVGRGEGMKFQALETSKQNA